MLVVSWFIGSIINYIVLFYIFKYILTDDKKINFSVDKAFYIILLSAINCILLHSNLIDIKPYVLQTILFVEFKVAYRKSFVKTLLGMVFCVLIVGISEMFFGVGLNIIKADIFNISNSFFGYILLNATVSVLAIILIKHTFFHRIFTSIIKWYEENEKISSLILGILVITIIQFSLYNNFISILPPFLLFITNLFCIGVFVFIIGFFKEKSANNKLRNEYQQLMNYVGTYERLLDERNKSQHEFKNQLIIINDMIKTKKAKEYIKQLINIEDQNFEYSWINKLKNFPSGGIKGLIYYKIQKMIENRIEVCVDISDELDNKSVWKNFNNNLKDISMIIGVYIDNAIEACLEAPKKIIIIDAYLENKKICIGITNTYKQIKIDKIKQEKYTTKGIGHGYGLSLVKDILSENDNIKTKREINGMYYTERVYVKK